MKEVWKNINIKGYEELYQISNFGNIKSIKRRRYIPLAKKTIYINKELILKQHNSKGYNFVILRNNNKTKIITIHRLVALTFIPNPYNYVEVNHKDGNKLNNKAENLEWCTKSQNIRHAFKTGLKQARKGEKNEQAKCVCQYDKNMNKIKIWGCISDIERILNIDHSTVIRCAKHKQKTAGGYRWEYV